MVRPGTAATRRVTPVAVALLVAVAVWAASRGPARVADGAGRGSQTGEARRATISLQALPRGGASSGGDQVGSILAAVVATVMSIVGLVILLFVLVQLWRLLTWLWERRLRDGDDVEVAEDLTAEEALAARLRAGAAEQADLLERGSPRNAVVACWHRFEREADAAGLARRPAETSSEFTVRLLDLVEADASAVARLAGLYREARFSEHELDERDRDAARSALRTIHRELGGLLHSGVR